ncbi:uncharacterized protein LOC115272674 [Suricata suricatta]|uniref:uncharacterized protein LOC115272674 n=1 Tax=Suricata suricatta TaxID=37032 RepID=UPI00115638C6|nr:uncharacterized protein LOC115272674 [Suricata suricatta]
MGQDGSLGPTVVLIRTVMDVAPSYRKPSESRSFHDMILLLFSEDLAQGSGRKRLVLRQRAGPGEESTRFSLRLLYGSGKYCRPMIHQTKELECHQAHGCKDTVSKKISKKFLEKRKMFVNSVSEDALNNLLDVLSRKVLNQEEIDIVIKGNTTTVTKARDLVNITVCIRSHASQISIDSISKTGSILTCKLGFSSEPVRDPEAQGDILGGTLVLQTDKVLKTKRKQFINSVSTGTVNGLLDELFGNNVLNQEEMDGIKCENATVMDKARALIDIILRKGPRACQLAITYICEEDTHLAEMMEFCSSSQSGNSLTDRAAAAPPLPEDKHDKKPLKTLESVGKELLTDFLQGLVKKDVLKLKEAEKKEFYDAKPRDKPRVLLDSMRERHKEAGQAIAETFLNMDKRSTSVEALGENTPGPAETEELTDTLKLCPQEEFVKLYKQKAEEIYPIKEKKDRTRLALIICNTKFDHLPPRNGAEFDIKGMKKLLTDLGYSVDLKLELSAKVGTPHLPQTSTCSTCILLLTHQLYHVRQKL